MKIILTARVSGLGTIGNVVEVKNGYAKNFLIPNKKAICLTKNNEKLFETRKVEFEKENEESLNSATEIKNKLIAQNIIIIENASDDGRLYGSVNSTVIAEKINEFLKSSIIKKSDIILNKPIKEIGVHHAKLDLHSDIAFDVKLVVTRSELEVESILKVDEKAKKDASKALKAEKELKESSKESKKEENKKEENIEENKE